MNWANIRLIMAREIRDQLRDRRTLFAIAVLPLLLYPLIGMGYLQIAQFMAEQRTRIWLVGTETLPDVPPLLVDGKFEGSLHTNAEHGRLYELTITPEVSSLADVQRQAARAIRDGRYDAVICFGRDFPDALVRASPPKGADGSPAPERDFPEALQGEEAGPEIFYDQAKDSSRIAYERLNVLLTRWRNQIVDSGLRQRAIPQVAAQPFHVVQRDVSRADGRRAMAWSKIVPFVMLAWALTGAFYPAIDLCAGEKERGTLETLLCSPALRSEIVWGKLLTVTLFSMSTSLLNLTSMATTGVLIMGRLAKLAATDGRYDIGIPPLWLFGWFVLILVPIAALFSALSMAFASMARSSKEGQYYLMPLMLVSMPLLMLPLMPAVDLDLGNSLIPVTGVFLLLRSLVEGQYWVAARFAIPVMGVTCVCCWLAIRWATTQFEDESVLFHDSDRFRLRWWLVHLVRDRADLPTPTQAIMCGMLLLLIRFFSGFAFTAPTNWASFVELTLATQLVFILTPALLMAVVLTRNVRRTLSLRWPPLQAIPAAVLLAAVLHPAATAFSHFVQTLYPLSEQALAQLQPLQDALGQAPSIWHVVLLLAVLPAICEEVAFRGFMLAGLRRMGPGLAIVLTSLFFGIAHTLLQQSLTAFALGLILGFLAIRTGSLIPSILFHVTHNSLQLAVSLLVAKYGWPFHAAGKVNDMGMVEYASPVVVASAAASMLVLYWLHLTLKQSEAQATRKKSSSGAVVVAG